MPTGENDRPTLGMALRAAREQAGATVEQVSADTRLRATVIRDLEGDSFRSSGGSVYARGHVKSIARALNLDPGPLLAVFDATQGSTKGPPLLDPEPLPQEMTSFGGSAFAGAAAALVPERRGPRWGMAVAAACVALAAIIGIGYLNQPSPASRPLAVIALPSATPSATSPATPGAVTTPDPGAVVAKPTVTGAQLRVRLIDGRSWVSVSDSNGTTVYEGILNAGEFRDFSDPTRLKIVVGNAKVVNLNCDGHDSGPAGGSGAVAKFACTPSGLTSL